MLHINAGINFWLYCAAGKYFQSLLVKVAVIVTFRSVQRHLMFDKLYKRSYMVTRTGCDWKRTFILGLIVWS